MNELDLLKLELHYDDVEIIIDALSKRRKALWLSQYKESDPNVIDSIHEKCDKMDDIINYLLNNKDYKDYYYTVISD